MPARRAVPAAVAPSWYDDDRAMTREDARLWVAHHREGQARIRTEHRERPVEAQRSLARAFALMDFAEKFRTRSAPDPISEREDVEVLAAWARLRAAWIPGRQ